MSMTANFEQERLARDQLILEAMHKISCPTLVVRGERSDVFSDEKAAAFAAAMPDGCWVKVARAGHTIQTDNPAGLLDALTPFLKKIIP
jgi:pimeloyl-ACP methyl ester carboxylesterase